MALAIDEFLSDYYNGGLKADFSQLTPYQRLSIFFKLLGIRLPKFKAIDLHTSGEFTLADIEIIVGKMLRPLMGSVREVKNIAGHSGSLDDSDVIAG